MEPSAWLRISSLQWGARQAAQREGRFASEICIFRQSPFPSRQCRKFKETWLHFTTGKQTWGFKLGLKLQLWVSLQRLIEGTEGINTAMNWQHYKLKIPMLLCHWHRWGSGVSLWQESPTALHSAHQTPLQFFTPLFYTALSFSSPQRGEFWVCEVFPALCCCVWPCPGGLGQPWRCPWNQDGFSALSSCNISFPLVYSDIASELMKILKRSLFSWWNTKSLCCSLCHLDQEHPIRTPHTLSL